MKNLAIIPARGGSKGLPGKNYKLFNGKPLIAYTIEAALDSHVFDTVIVSTDDEKIKKIALDYGADVPFIRPSELASDEASSDDAVMHAIDYFDNVCMTRFNTICKLQVTSPLRTSGNIKLAYELMCRYNANNVVSVCECEHSPLWSGIISEDLRIDDFMNRKLAITNRQKLQTYYRLNGAIYIAKTEEFKKNKCFFGKNSIAYIMKKEESIDIDDLMDFKFAELIMNIREKNV